MDDGPEEAASHFDYRGKVYRLDEREIHQWRVLDGGVHIGTVIEVSTTLADGVQYTIKIADGRGAEPETTEDWQRAIEMLIDLATF